MVEKTVVNAEVNGDLYLSWAVTINKGSEMCFIYSYVLAS